VFLTEAAVAPTGDPVGLLLTYGPLGVMAVLFILRLIIPTKALTTCKEDQEAAAALLKVQYEERIRSLEQRSQSLEVVNATLNQKYQDEMVPALIHATDMTRQTLDLIRIMAGRNAGT
jgi:hypothetical protein